ncbi:sialic acid-binding Ig-like lectin 13 isoform X3 [Girardinichthys multiradiatus]|uniref:sialic acid-binding Ig-like lectin 13 isoform X3 n=1 Tax=Girardinichthys multiradiatus TaxID=208333 RepID=UPI001FADFE1C|nr:sialic acid-binding Ig-like lectin 13 isoform X3 [Girardinichthys multiradiatus]
MKDYQSLMATLSENVLRVNMLLSVFLVLDALAFCGDKTPGLIITAPNNIEALNGSCLQIPCTYNTTDQTFDNSRPIYGVWMKGGLNFASDPNIVIFNSSKSVNIYQLEMIGNLTEKNCTTLFPDLNTSYTNRYFFRAENGPVKATACADSLPITVKDSPWSPSINISGGDLKEHQSVTITCSALTPCPHSPPELTWNLQQDSHRQTEKNTDGTFTTKIQENITLLDTHDGYNIRCSARYPVNGGNKTAETAVTLSVSYAPRNTLASISPSGLVSAGSWVELNCSSRAKPPASFTWFRNSKHGAINVSVGQVYSFNFTEGGEFYCVATNDLGNETSSVILDGIKDGLSVPITVGISLTIFLIVCLVVSVWCFKYKHITLQQTQSQTGAEAAVQISDANNTEGEVLYGEVKIIKKTPEVSSVPVHDSKQQETIYGQVKVSKDASAQTADSPEDLYAQVKKK